MSVCCFTAVHGAAVTRKEYQFRVETDLFATRAKGMAHVRQALQRIAADPTSDMTVVDLKGRNSHYKFMAFDTADKIFRRNGICLRMKLFMDRLYSKYYVLIKVNSIDADTLHPPLSVPTDRYATKAFTKLEQDLHAGYTKFAQSTTIRTKTKPSLEKVSDLREWYRGPWLDFPWLEGRWDSKLEVTEQWYIWRKTDLLVKFGNEQGQGVVEVVYPHHPSQKPEEVEISFRIKSEKKRTTRSAHKVFQDLIHLKGLSAELTPRPAVNIGPRYWPTRKRRAGAGGAGGGSDDDDDEDGRAGFTQAIAQNWAWIALACVIISGVALAVHASDRRGGRVVGVLRRPGKDMKSIV